MGIWKNELKRKKRKLVIDVNWGKWRLKNLEKNKKNKKPIFNSFLLILKVEKPIKWKKEKIIRRKKGKLKNVISSITYKKFFSYNT